MLVDDDEPTNFLSSMIIEEACCTEHLQIEDSGWRAINYLATSAQSGYNHKNYPWPDLIFLDINMPAMNGWEFLDKYKEFDKEHRAEVTIIMLTTSLNPDDTAKAIEMPAVSGFEIKPLTSELLNKVINKYFTSYNQLSL
jgi:CheY-like chemotaxis protein